MAGRKEQSCESFIQVPDQVLNVVREYLPPVDFNVLNTSLYGFICRHNPKSYKFKSFLSLAQAMHLAVKSENYIADPYSPTPETSFNNMTARPDLIAACKVLQELGNPQGRVLRSSVKTMSGLYVVEISNDTIVATQSVDGTWNAQNKPKIEIEDRMSANEIVMAKEQIIDFLWTLVGGSGEIQGRVLAGEAQMVMRNGTAASAIGCIARFERFFKLDALSRDELAVYVLGRQQAVKSGYKSADDIYTQTIRHLNRALTSEELRIIEHGHSMDELVSVNGGMRWESPVLHSKISSIMGIERKSPYFLPAWYDLIWALRGVPLQRFNVSQYLLQYMRAVESCSCHGDAYHNVSPTVAEKIGLGDAGSWTEYREDSYPIGSSSLGLIFQGGSYVNYE